MPILLLILLPCLSFLPFLSLAIVPAIIIFGDSTFDTGNNNTIPTLLTSNFVPYGRDFLGKPYPTGRFSNGRLTSDFYAEAFGLDHIVPACLVCRLLHLCRHRPHQRHLRRADEFMRL
ncbi:Triacylglycerol lipase protein [Dioscorea alata]|uniref:Triacylglycerol lipase protein n=4 Tax=Dioscorea alata TaxID=55571 RepID=A0ACB7V9Z4_DIOAL|nr:Triacylglycerol lipase protein [Dioscorea alata]KAH7670490.1 Triacylglycerol lipase protein [Dioscorea alata]KAH7670491.1 Triacylglycerol lipase protein [Dioscorea alata]KAH7670493.1 Triacylglycerol lipase protein [Dioscorea alata]